MVNDDFSALDFLSVGGFRLSSCPAVIQRPAKKKRFVLRRKPSVPAKRRLAELLPLLGRKLVQPMTSPKLGGWSMALSWPRAETRVMPNWDEAAERLHS